MSSPPNLRQIGTRFHERLMAGSSPTVTSEIAEVFTPTLSKSLCRQFFNIADPTLIDTAVTDAVIGYFAHPERFDPIRSSLFTYLRLRAASNLLNELARERRYESPKDFVEVEPEELVSKEDDVEESLINRELNERVMARLKTILPDAIDQE